MGLLRVRDSAVVQFVLAREKASVAARKTEISVVWLVGCEGEDVVLNGWGSEGIALGFWVEVMGAGSLTFWPG